MDVGKSNAGEFPRVFFLSPFVFSFILSEDLFELHVTVFINTETETDLYPGIYMHRSADQILVVVVLMFVTCVHKNALCNLLRYCGNCVHVPILSHFTFDVKDRNTMCR